MAGMFRSTCSMMRWYYLVFGMAEFSSNELQENLFEFVGFG